MATSVLNMDRARTEHQASALADAAESNTRFRWIILIGLVLAAAMELLDTTIINVALPQIAGNLSTTTQEVAWVSTGYTLSNVVVLPMTAFFNSFFGRRNYLVGSVILFTVASIFAGSSHSLGELVLWRIMQGAGGAALLSTAQATLVQIFSQAEQAVVQPIFLLGLVLFPTIGPAIGGYITDVVNWNWCFFINIPLGIISALIILFLLRDTTAPDTQTPVDWLGIALLVVGLASMQYVLEEGQQDDWFSSQVIVVMTIISFVGITGLIAWLLTPLNKHPILNIKILTNSSLSGGILLFIAVGFGVYGVNYLFPLLAQQQEGLTPLQSGLALLPGGIASTVSIVGCGILANTKLDARLQTFTGIILSAIGMFFMAHLSSQSSTNDTFWPMIIRGFSIGFLFVPVNQMAIGSLSGSDVNEGTGLLGLGRQLGGSIGVAIIATSLQNSQFVNRANMVGSLTTNNPAYVSRVADLSGVLVGHGFSHTDSQQSAVGLINQILMQQVSAKSFDDTFILLMVVSILMIPTLIMLKKPKPGAAAAPMH